MSSPKPVAGQPFTLSLALIAQGDENSSGFSVHFDPARFEYLGYTISGGGVQVLVNRNGAASGNLGFAVSQAAGRTFAAGTNSLIGLQLRARGTTGTTRLDFADVPVIRETVGIQAQTLPTLFDSVEVEILPLIGPSIMTQPQGVTVHAGTNLTLTVEAAGSAPLAYQWQLGGQPITAATNAALELRAIQENQAGEYRVVVSNPGGSITSDVATVTVLPPLVLPSIVRQPIGAVASAGETMAFSVQAAGSEPLSYQWQFQNKDLASQTDKVLTLANLNANQSGSYRVIVRNPVGSVTSATAPLAVSATPRQVSVGQVNVPAGTSLALPVVLRTLGDENAVGFSIRFEPAHLEYKGVQRGASALGANLVLNTNLLAEGRVGVVLAKAAGEHFGASTAPILLFNFLARGITGSNVISLEDRPVLRELADASGQARITDFRNGYVNVLDTPPSILAAPASTVARIFSPVGLQVSATGSEPMYYQWLLDGEPVAGATNPILSFASVMPDQAGDYQVVVSNAVSTVTSPAARLDVRRVVCIGGTNVPTGTAIAMPLELLTAGTENALGFSLNYDPTRLVLRSTALDAGYSNILFNLRTNANFPGVLGVALAQQPGATFAVGTQAVLTLTFEATQTPGNTPLSFADVPVLRELAGSDARPVATEFVDGEVVTVRMAPQISRHPVPREVLVGESAVFAVVASGSLPLAYQWLHNGTDIAGATNTTFSIVSAELTDAGNYAVRLGNIVGTVVSSNALLTVNLPDTAGPALANPTFEYQPLEPNVRLTHAGTLRINASDPSGVSRVEFYADDTQLGADVDGQDGYSANLDPALFPDGPHTVVFKAYDFRSNPSTLSVDVQFALVPPGPPVIGYPPDGTVTGSPTILVRGSAPLRSSVALYRNGVRVGVPTPVSILGIFETTLALAEGTNVVEAVALNRAGESPRSPAIAVVLDTSIPAGPSGLRATARSGGRVLLEWVPATESLKGFHVYRAASSFTNQSQAVRLTGARVPATSFDDVPPADGRWFYRITKVNLANAEGYLSTEVAVDSDNTPPTAAIEYQPHDHYDPATGRFGRTIVGVLVNLSEPVDGAPFLSFTPPLGLPTLVDLTPVTTTQYRGNFAIGDTTTSGNAVAVFSARDRAGNRGTRILSGGQITIDTAAPKVVALSIQPAEPLRNNPDDPVLVTLGLALNEGVRTGTVPEFTFTLSQSAPTPQPVASLTPGADPVHWTVTLKLPREAGQSAETLTIQYQGEDDLGNSGSDIEPHHEFQVYQGDLPALVAPVGLSAKTGPGGQITLEWQRVTGAVDYGLYRKTSSASEFTPLTYTGDTNRWVDLPSADGIYEYAVASVRRENAQESVGELSNVAVAESDRRPPGAPTALTLQLAQNGVFLRWTPPAGGNEEVTYAVFRAAQAPPADLTGLTPLIQRIPIAQVVDPAPRPDEPFYAVAAVDRAGNASPPSNTGYLNIQLFPVQSLIVSQTNNDPPILTWTQVGDNVAGHDLFLGDATSNLLLNRRGLITDNRFIDVGFTGDERRYTVFTVDNNRQRSPGRTLLLPLLSATLDPEAIVKRGLMNRLVYTVRNDSADPLNDARLLVALGGRVHSSEAFWLPGQSVTNIAVVVGGYADLPDNSAPLLTTLESHPDEGATVRWARSGSVAVGDGQLLIGVLAADLVRGGIAKARFSLINPSTEVLEVITATHQGNAASSDIRMSLFDAEGQLLSATPFLAASGTNLVLLPDGNVVLRLEPGQEALSQELDLPIPPTVPNHVWIRVEIDRVFYHSDQEDRVEMRGVQTSAPFVVVSTSYTGEVTSATPEHSRGEEPITLSGRASFRANRQPAPFQPLLVKIANGGFERTESVVTDANGLFSTQFTPLEDEGGGIYSVWAVHPDLTDRTVQQQFVVDRVLASPQQFTVRVPHYFKQAVPLKVTTGAGTEVANLRLTFLPEDQPSGALPTGVSVDTGAPIDRLGPNQTATINFLITGTPDASRKVSLVLRLVSGDTTQNPWAKIQVACEFSAAFPLLRWSPNAVDTGVPPGSNVIEQVTFENAGLVAATNVFFSLHNGDGTVAPSWAALTTPPNLAELPVGGQAIVGLTFRPPPGLAEGDYWFILRTRSGNHPKVDLSVHVGVMASGRGDLAFKVVDMYTGTPGNEGVRGARIRLRNDAFSSFETNLVTDAHGEAVFADLPSGQYDYQVTVENHNSSNGRAWVRAGSTANEHVALAYSLVSVEWEVVPITIEDRYEIVLQAVFETDVPAPVVTIDPPAVNLPQLFAGDVFYGEFVLENHGLIRADNLQFQLPASDAYMQYEILAGLPDHLDAHQKVRIPYRITCLTSFPGPRTPPATTNPALAQTRTAPATSPASYDDLPPAVRQIALMSGESSGCFTHSSTTGYTFSFDCINGLQFSGSGGTRYWYNYSPGNCGGSPASSGGTTVVGGPSGPGGAGVSGHAASIPGLPICCPLKPCESEGECDSKCCEAENGMCGAESQLPPTPGTPAPDGSSGPDDKRTVALANGDSPAAARFKFTNRLRCDATGHTYLDSDLRHLTFEEDSGGVSTITVGLVPYSYLDSHRTLFAYRGNRIRKTADGYHWENLDGNWEEYDASGRLLKTGHRNLLRTRRVYDGAGRLSQVFDALNNLLVTYSYNAGGQLASITDRFGRRTEYDYQGGRLVLARDVDRRETRYEYGPDPGCGQRSLVTRITLPNGTVQNYQYRSAGCDGPVSLYSLLDGAGNGRYHEYKYDANTRTYYAKTTTTGGEVREKTFDRDGNLVEERLNGRLLRSILRSGRTDLIADAAGNETQRDYDEFGKVVREVAPDGGVTTWEYEPRYHQPTRIEDPRGAVTLMSYDANGNLTNKIEAAGTPIARTNSWVYNSLNQLLRRVDGRGNKMDYAYDDAGNLIREFDPDNAAYQTLYGYDPRGNRSAVTNDLGSATWFGYDAKDRLIAETNALGYVTLNTYTDDHLVEVETGRDGANRGRSVRYGYDDHGRRTQTLRVDGEGTEHVWETTTYDTDGNVIAVANALDQTTHYEYDAEGRRMKIARPFSATETSDTRYEYDDAGHLVREIDPLGVVTQYAYDELGRQKRVTEALGTDVQRSRERSYDLAGNLTSLTYSDGTNAFTTFYEYDLLNRRVAIRGAREYPRQFEYDANDNLIAEINGRGYRTGYAYDQYNRRTNTVEGIGPLTRPSATLSRRTGEGRGEGIRLMSGDEVSSPGEHAGSIEYDLLGQVVTSYDGNGNHRHYHYDALGRQTEQSIPLAPTNTLPAGNWWTDDSVVLNRTWLNPWDQPVATSNIVGGVTATVYDAFGLQFTHTDAAGLTLTNEYTPLDQLSAINYPPVSSAPPGSPPTSIRYAYDANNAQMLVSTTDRANLTTYYGYDKRFQPAGELSSWGALTTYRTDALGRQTAVTNALNEVTQSVFDQFDQLVATIYADDKPDDRRIEYRAYDEFGNMTNHWGAATYDVGYAYDLAGNQISLTDGNGNTTRWEYDGRNRKVRKIYADNSDYEYGYDTNGNQTRKRDAMQRTTRYEFNAYNLLARTDYPNDSDVTFGYDPAGRRVLMIDATGTNTWRLDASDHILENAQGGSKSTATYSYDSSGDLVSFSAMFGPTATSWTVHYGHDFAGQLEEVRCDTLFTGAIRYRRSSCDHCITDVLYPDGSRTAMTYDTLARKTNIVLYTVLGDEALSLQYTFDRAGRMHSESDNKHTSIYLYNDKSELVKDSSYTESPQPKLTRSKEFQYDSVGNRTSEKQNGTITHFTANRLNQLCTVSNSSQVTLLYDALGNMVFDGYNTFTFDEANRIVVLTNRCMRMVFDYDGLGRCVNTSGWEAEAGTFDEAICFNGLVPTAALTDDGGGEFVAFAEDRWGTLPCEYALDAAVAIQKGNETNVLIWDGVGNVRILHDLQGGGVRLLGYEPFGSNRGCWRCSNVYYAYLPGWLGYYRNGIHEISTTDTQYGLRSICQPRSVRGKGRCKSLCICAQ